MAKRSVATVKKEKQAFTQAVAEHKRALTTFCQTMESSTVAMAAILAQTIMITECKDLLKKQLGQTVSRLYNAISDSTTIGSVPDNEWVHWKGGSHWSGQDHAECIVRGLTRSNVIITTQMTNHKQRS